MPDSDTARDGLLTVAEVATWLKVEPRYIYRLASSGDIARVYVGRYLRFYPLRWFRSTSTNTLLRPVPLSLRAIVALVPGPARVLACGW